MIPAKVVMVSSLRRTLQRFVLCWAN